MKLKTNYRSLAQIKYNIYKTEKKRQKKQELAKKRGVDYEPDSEDEEQEDLMKRLEEESREYYEKVKQKEDNAQHKKEEQETEVKKSSQDDETSQLSKIAAKILNSAQFTQHKEEAQTPSMPDPSLKAEITQMEEEAEDDQEDDNDDMEMEEPTTTQVQEMQEGPNEPTRRREWGKMGPEYEKIDDVQHDYIEHQDPRFRKRRTKAQQRDPYFGINKHQEKFPMPTPKEIKEMQQKGQKETRYDRQLSTVFDFNVIERNTVDYKKFVQKLEHNFNSPSSKLSVCLLCWAFIPSHLKKRHLEHEPYIVTASFFKNEESFIKLCKENGKISGNNTRLITFKEACQFSVGPQSAKLAETLGNNYGASQVFGGGQNPLHNIGDVNTKQFEFEFQIKRMNAVVCNIQQENSTTDKTLDRLETQFKMVQSQIQCYLMEKKRKSEAENQKSNGDEEKKSI